MLTNAVILFLLAFFHFFTRSFAFTRHSACDIISTSDRSGRRFLSRFRSDVDHAGADTNRRRVQSPIRSWTKATQSQVRRLLRLIRLLKKELLFRFLRHVPVVYVDYPGPISLKQIYGTFNRAMLKRVPYLRQYAEPLTEAMVAVYSKSQERFTQDMQPHYIYSPREMTRWVRGISEALQVQDSLSVEGLVRIWAHEGLRLFQDR